MKDVLLLHVGQCGIQQGAKLIETLTIEHNISETGKLQKGSDGSHFSFFQEQGQGRYVPRAIFIDLESLVCDRLRGGRFKDLFSQNQFISGVEDAANVFARGRNGSKKLFTKAMNSIRKVVETSNTIGGLLSFQASSGGTGSGFGSLILEEIADRFNTLTRIAYTTHPSRFMSTSVLAPYNTIFNLNTMTNICDINISLDNQSLYRIAQPVLEFSNGSPSFDTLNELVCRVCSDMTASLRFDGELHIGLQDYKTNLVPYPRINHMMVSHAPITNMSERHFDSTTTESITLDSFDPKYLMCDCEPLTGRYIAITLNYRGDVKPDAAHKAVLKAKEIYGIKFVQWMPTGTKISVNHEKIKTGFQSFFAESNKAITTCANNTDISSKFERISTQFDMLYKNRAFCHWFLDEGMLEEDFLIAREQIAALQNDYKDILGMTTEDDEDFTTF